VGEGARLEGTPWISNAGSLTIGRRFRLASCPVPSHLVVARAAALEIGDDVTIAHGAAVAAHERITLGAGCRIGPFVSISDTDFHVAGRRDAAPETTPIRVEAGVRIGARVSILRGAWIGEGAVVASASVVSGVVPAGARVAGVPARAISADASRTETDALERVPAIFAAALGLTEVPGREVPRESLAAWDSLGSLQVLLALEEAFGITLDEGAVAAARNVAELEALVERAQALSSAS
jgi:acetyltransferase-like isoleucine patch superfamily enzyme/acyl carrier protein